MIPYGHQTIDDGDVAAVVAVLRGDWLTQGPAVEEFERALADAVDALHAVAFCNGTAALHAACAAAGLGPGDTVATSTLSFVASANCARYVGAQVMLLDIDPETLNLDPCALPAGLDALVAVHYAGNPLDLGALTHRPRIVIEDACHALGARTSDGPVGNCARSDMCCFSFHPVKVITTGEGGAVTTNSADLAEALRRFRSHGLVRFPDRGEWYQAATELGWNYRLTDIAAALGASQLAKLPRFVAHRQTLANRYRARLADLAVTLPPPPGAGATHAYHLFPVQIAERDRVFGELRRAGIGVQVHYVPIHRQPTFADVRFQSGHGGAGAFPAADAAYEQLLTLPLFPGLSDGNFDKVVTELRRAL